MGKWGVTLTGASEVETTLDVLDNIRFDGHVVKSGVDYAVYVEFGTKNMDANGALRASTAETMANLDSVIDGADDGNEITEAIAKSIAQGWREGVWVDTGRLRDSITVVKKK